MPFPFLALFPPFGLIKPLLIANFLNEWVKEPEA